MINSPTVIARLIGEVSINQRAVAQRGGEFGPFGRCQMDYLNCTHRAEIAVAYTPTVAWVVCFSCYRRYTGGDWLPVGFLLLEAMWPS